jgi:hypothetical protein
LAQKKGQQTLTLFYAAIDLRQRTHGNRRTEDEAQGQLLEIDRKLLCIHFDTSINRQTDGDLTLLGLCGGQIRYNDTSCRFTMSGLARARVSRKSTARIWPVGSLERLTRGYTLGRMLPRSIRQFPRVDQLKERSTIEYIGPPGASGIDLRRPRIGSDAQ